MTTLSHFLHSHYHKNLIAATLDSFSMCVNEQDIMDDAKGCLPHANHNAINNVQLYLQVAYLSEITDASGTTVLPHALQDGPSSTRSTLKWPHQLPPTSTAWKHWQCARWTLYLQTESDHLAQPLKE